MPPIRKGDGTPVTPKGISQIRTGDGRILFDGVAIRDSVLLPQLNDLDNFTGDTDTVDINNDTPKANTEFTDLSLKWANPTSGDDSIQSLTGLDNYPDVGDTHRFWYFPDDPNDSQQRVYFGNDSDTGRNNCYTVIINKDNDEIFIQKVTDGSSFDNLATSSNVGMPDGEFIEGEVLHENDGTITFTLYDNSGTELDSISGSDTDFITDGSYDNSGIGIENPRPVTDAFDFWRIV